MANKEDLKGRLQGRVENNRNSKKCSSNYYVVGIYDIF